MPIEFNYFDSCSESIEFYLWFNSVYTKYTGKLIMVKINQLAKIHHKLIREQSALLYLQDCKPPFINYKYNLYLYLL